MPKRLCLLLLPMLGCQEYTIDGTLDAFTSPPDGVDLEPMIAVTPESLDFGARGIDCPAAGQALTVTNLGGATLTVRSIYLEGSDVDAYQVDPPTLTLAPGASAEVQVTFSPTQRGDYIDAGVLFLSDDPNQGRTDVPVAGTSANHIDMQDEFQQVDPNTVDVLFVVDNSGSMTEELDEVATAFDAFISSFDRLGLDYHVGVTTTDMEAEAGLLLGELVTHDTPDPVASFTQLTSLGIDGSGEERGFDAARTALSDDMLAGPNQGFIREDANLAVVVVSDEDDSSNVNATTFANWLDSMKSDSRDTSFSAIAGPDSASYFPTFACDLVSGNRATTAPRYHDAIDLTGGVSADICEADLAPFLGYLAQVAAGLHTEFALQETPSDLTNVEVLVEGELVPWGASNGWVWNPDTQSVRLHGDVLPPPGSKIVVRYRQEPSCEP